MGVGVSLRTGQLVQQLVLTKHQHRSDTDGAFVHRLKMVGNTVKVCIKFRSYCTWVKFSGVILNSGF